MPHNDVPDHSYSAIYHGTVRHARYMPKKHRFAYKVFSLLLDIDQLETLSKNLKLFSFNRFNIFSFRTSDHGAKDGSPFRPFIEKILDKETSQSKMRFIEVTFFSDFRKLWEENPKELRS